MLLLFCIGLEVSGFSFNLNVYTPQHVKDLHYKLNVDFKINLNRYFFKIIQCLMFNALLRIKQWKTLCEGIFQSERAQCFKLTEV